MIRPSSKRFCVVRQNVRTTLLPGGQCLDQEETQSQRPGKRAAQHSQGLAPYSERVGGQMCIVNLLVVIINIGQQQW